MINSAGLVGVAISKGLAKTAKQTTFGFQANQPPGPSALPLPANKPSAAFGGYGGTTGQAAASVKYVADPANKTNKVWSGKQAKWRQNLRSSMGGNTPLAPINRNGLTSGVQRGWRSLRAKHPGITGGIKVVGAGAALQLAVQHVANAANRSRRSDEEDER